MPKFSTRLRVVVFGLFLVSIPVAAIAGEYVSGTGPTRAAAMQNAEDRAARRAQGLGTCYRPARVENCVQDSGEWICRAEVTYYTRAEGRMCPS